MPYEENFKGVRFGRDSGVNSLSSLRQTGTLLSAPYVVKYNLLQV